MAACPASDPSGAHILQDLEGIVKNLFNYIIPFAGMAAFVVLIVGGFQYLTAGGDPKKVQQAQGIITGAVIGIIVTLGVYLIFRLLGLITGLDLLRFEIPG